MRRVNQGVASLDRDARRHTMDADVTADKKTRERTEGASATVQGKYRDRCSAKRAQAGPTSSVSARKLNLPLSLAGMTSWSTAALRRQRRVFHPWRCAHQQLPVANFPLAKPLQRQGSLTVSSVSPNRVDEF